MFLSLGRHLKYYIYLWLKRICSLNAVHKTTFMSRSFETKVFQKKKNFHLSCVQRKQFCPQVLLLCSLEAYSQAAASNSSSALSRTVGLFSLTAPFAAPRSRSVTILAFGNPVMVTGLRHAVLTRRSHRWWMENFVRNKLLMLTTRWRRYGR